MVLTTEAPAKNAFHSHTANSIGLRMNKYWIANS